MDEQQKKDWEKINQQWSAGVGVGEPGYLNGACNLLYRFSNNNPAVPPNVALAIGYVCGCAMAAGDKPGSPPPRLRSHGTRENPCIINGVRYPPEEA